MGLSDSESAECGIAILKWMRRANTLTHLSLRVARLLQCGKAKKFEGCYAGFCLNGAGAMFLRRQRTIVLRRSDFIRLHDYAQKHAPLRDYCLIRVPMKCGLRPGEIRCLKWSQVDFDNLTLNVLDSKKHRIRLVPMDTLTAEYLRQLKVSLKGTVNDWVIQRGTQGGLSAWRSLRKPLSYDALDKIVKKWGKAAGCQTWRQMNLYMLRHFFAAHWAYVKRGNIHALSRILGHESVATTQVYLSKLVFYEDLQSEYRRLQAGPIAGAGFEPAAFPPKVGNWFFDKYCRFCRHQPTCKFIDEAMTSQWASGCKFYEPKEADSKLVKPRRNHHNYSRRVETSS